MSAIAYWYFVPYEPVPESALERLRLREFAAGRFFPAIDEPVFSEPGFSAQRPRRQYSSIAAARRAAGAVGTRSILDVETVADAGSRAGVASALREDELNRLFGTLRPSHDQVRVCDELFDVIERGRCVFLTVYENGEPVEYYFAGYALD